MNKLPYRHRARKRFGQNFLHDAHVIERIVRAIQPAGGQRLVEIGPGQGAITEPLLDSGAPLTAIEIDRDLAALLREKFSPRPNFSLIEQDVLKVDFEALAGPDGSLRVLGNLPYNISSPLLFHLLRYRELVHDMLFMLQLEVVRRLAAHPGDADYGRLSVMMQYHCEVELLFKVPPGAFNPRPKVDSAIVRLSPRRPLPCVAEDYACFSRVVQAAFSQRRKTLRNTLKGLIDEEQFRALGIDPSLRAEKLGVGDYVTIANVVSAAAANIRE